jgi:hypothetical protein
MRQELKSMKATQSDDIEWLMKNRGEAKARINSQIATACEFLKKEFNDDKQWARTLANRRWDTTINKVASVIDDLEAERKNRMRGETRIFDTVRSPCQLPKFPRGVTHFGAALVLLLV